MIAFLTAIRFLTRVPVPGPHGGAEVLGRAMVFFPLVGGLIGLLLAGVGVGAGWVWHNGAVSSTLVIVALLLVTGGLHLDGIMDACDGLFGGRNREHSLEIMKDSRVGAFGVLGAVCDILLRFSFFSLLLDMNHWYALIAMPILGRWALVYATAKFPYTRSQGTGKAFNDHVTRRHLLLAGAMTLILLGAVIQLLAIPLFLISWFVVWALGRYLTGRLGGLTGDCYGAISEVTEISVIAVLPILFPILHIITVSIY